MLGGQSALALVKLGDPARRHQEGLEQRCLPVLFQIRPGIRNRFGNVLAEAGVILLVTAFGGDHHHTVGRR